MSPTQRTAHHQIKNYPPQGQKSVFYIRCEEFGNSILIGNMQIDDKSSALAWADKAKGSVLLKRSNIYKMMIQEAIKHALDENKDSILFQAGHAADLAQNEPSKIYKNREIITEKNI